VSDPLAWLFSTQVFGIKLGLDNTRLLLDALGNPQEKLRFLHVAGTNGKGSTCAMLDAILRAEGLRTGLYTSPHLVDFRERVRVNGEKISATALDEILARIREISADWDHQPTFFEVSTCAAISHFAQAGCEAVVLETGMGGRLDATNAVTPAVSVLTPISFDHEKWLGSTLAEIAGEKCGIIKPGIPVVSAPQQPGAEEVIRQTAAERNAPLQFIDRVGPPTALAGEHQRRNSALACAALDAAGISVSENSITTGLAGLTWPGRFQILDDRIILDGAHNPQAAGLLVQTLRERGFARLPIIFGALRDKDYSAMLRHLEPVAERFLFVPVPGTERAESPEKFMTSTPSAIFPGVKEALASLDGPVLVTGSLFLVGEAMKVLSFEP
jgi:dihydrofolate synthase/folylpolyglutamate synthase